MSHEFESGFMVRTPSWHGLENAVLSESPRTWEEARKQAKLTWDVTTGPVYVDSADAMDTDGQVVDPPVTAPGWQALRRDDGYRDLLSIQPSTYQVVYNREFGEIIDTMLGMQKDEFVNFEALMSLYGGRQVVALAYFPDKLNLSWDPSENYSFLAFSSRHDGNGGIRGIPTNVRVVCANTLSLAEMMDGRTSGFSIRHTGNWKERIEEIRRELAAARGESKIWEEFAEQLALWRATPRRRDDYLKRFLPVTDALSPRGNENQLINRQRIRDILESPTCEHIADTGYGLLMATTEWSDHVRPHQSPDTFVARQLLRAEPNKKLATKILSSMAGIKG